MAGRPLSVMRSIAFLVCVCGMMLPFSRANAQSPIQLPQEPVPADTALAQAWVDSSFEFSYSDPDRAIEFANKALELSEQLDYREGTAGALRELGYAWNTKGEFSKALDHFEKGLALNRAMEDTVGILSYLSDMGSIYRKQSNYDRALEYYFESLDLCEAIGLERGIGANLTSIGLVYFEMEEHDKALEFYTEALAISKERGDKTSLAVNYNNIGLLHGDEGRYDRALENHFKALKLRRELGYTIEIANSLNNIGRMYMQQERYGEAVDYLRQAYKVNDGNDPELTTIIHENLAKTYRSAGQLDSALVHARKTVELSEEFGTKLGVRVGFELLTDIHRKRGELEKALVAQQQLMAVKDSILNAEKTRQINELQTKYETEKKEKEIALLEKEKQRQALLRNAFLAGLILVGIIGLLVYNRQRLKIRKNRAELENRRLQEQRLQQDLEFRNRQLTTHTLHLVQKNGTMLELKEKIGELRHAGNSNGEGEGENTSMNLNRALQKLEHLVDYSFHLDEDWEQFRLCFEEVHPGFFDELREKYPELTPNELRLAALARLNLSVKEIAAVMGITPDSVKTARYRLRKKLDMETEENLTEFMMRMG